MNYKSLFLGLKNKLLKRKREVKIIDNLNYINKLELICGDQNLIYSCTSGMSNYQNSINIIRDEFLLFHYAYHMPLFNGFANLGDYVQTIATKNALISAFGPSIKFRYWDRDSLRYYNGDDSNQKIITCIMQGWFSHSLNFSLTIIYYQFG